MLDELADQYAALVFSFSSPAAQHYSKSGTGRDPAFIQYLFLKKYLVDGSPDIDAISDIFCHDPHRKIEKQFQPCGIHECTAVNAAIAGMILNGPMAKLHQPHPLQATALARILMHKTNKALYPQTAARESRFQTFDTHENRFIKFFLQELLWKIEAISTALDPDTSSYSQPFIPDIVVEKAGKKLIFDAKYKGRKGSGGFYGEDDQGSVWTWKPEDINKMHTYREAITGVAGSFVLFPGSTSIIYPKNDLDSTFEDVGAFCLRPDLANSPDNTTRKHIRTVLSEFLLSA